MEAAGSQCMAFAATTYLSKRGLTRKRYMRYVRRRYGGYSSNCLVEHEHCRTGCDKKATGFQSRRRGVERYKGPNSTVSSAWPMIDEAGNSLQVCVDPNPKNVSDWLSQLTSDPLNLAGRLGRIRWPTGPNLWTRPILPSTTATVSGHYTDLA